MVTALESSHHRPPIFVIREAFESKIKTKGRSKQVPAIKILCSGSKKLSVGNAKNELARAT
jgi:hypothetical protein